jgi:hypothetical protein
MRNREQTKRAPDYSMLPQTYPVSLSQKGHTDTERRANTITPTARAGIAGSLGAHATTGRKDRMDT